MLNFLKGFWSLLKSTFISTNGKAHISVNMENKDVTVMATVKVAEFPTIKSNNIIRVKRPVTNEFPINSPFGWREDPYIKGHQKFHGGIDFKCPIGTPVYAMADGEIDAAGWVKEDDHQFDFGLRIRQNAIIDGKQFILWYGHLSELKIKAVEQVKEGQLIALTGNTGHSTGPHLHVQAREKDTSQLYDLEFYG